MSARVRVGIVGASGYSGEELVRLLLGHPRVELTAVTSRQYAGRTVAQVFPKFASHSGARTLRFSEPNVDLLATQAQVVFLALPHGVAAEFAVPLLQRGCQVIDLSADFRLRSPDVYREFYAHDHPAPDLLAGAVYGLVEVYRDTLRGAALVASPGCYPTSILLPSIPLLRQQLVKTSGVIANSLSGVSGAGRKAEIDYLFVECNESMRPYAVPKHRHLSEIEQELSAAAGAPVVIQFTPHLIPVSRGILTTLYFTPSQHVQGADQAAAFADTVAACYQAAYPDQPFVRLLQGNALPDTKNVVGTNVVEIAWRVDPRTGRLIVMSAVDNVVKGASGQAVQCFNVLSGFDETTGLL
ncbi:MAG: N-acetyl-gamma-glutamyl-phosphate reductase [Verrucomicrobia bacterium]|nr:N-acetyl-gamma-glutamyl-phosphate reductase [Verrucomicrobiota bacterium]MDI9380357.1 N-acetyl-gamma-glutamyl-phosphate reductase [Verrucomicrobiota bacterium]NMD20717.1 N-acetyl-gamma-glutamyl-phosphate reductase [Verrucomicrobiota bacterium]HNU99306.1 N-acetyl-gamma-glutamyl-phosphate reductase [Verrucomicrobiota bacterium]HOA60654.1 N-acetyl-gamma-glutamyl-phosphate reductase [Verrucomicrobiota bacterium]